MSWGERLDRWGESVSDRLNAILVREMRRVMSGRAFIAVFLIFLLLSCLVVLVTVADSPRPGSGLKPFRTLALCFAAACYLGVPILLVSHVQAEKKEGTLELVSITTLSGARIVWGELLVALGLLLLLCSAVAPFMLFCYLLGGTDVRMTATVLAFILFSSVLLCLIAIALAVATKRALLANGLPLLLGLVALSITAGSIELSDKLWDDSDALSILAGILTFYASLVAVFFVIAAAQLTFESANRTAPPRLAIGIHMLVTGFLCLLTREKGWLTAGMVYSLLWLFFLAMGVLGEDETLTRRQLRLSRWASSFPTLRAFFLPGAARGLFFVHLVGLVAASAITFGAFAIVEHTSDSRRVIIAAAAWVGYAYLLFYTTVSHAIARRLPERWQTPAIRRAPLLLIFLVTLILPFLAILFSDGGLDREDQFALVWNPTFSIPVMVSNPNDDYPIVFVTAIVLGMIGAILAVPTAVRSIGAITDAEFRGGRR